VIRFIAAGIFFGRRLSPFHAAARERVSAAVYRRSLKITSDERRVRRPRLPSIDVALTQDALRIAPKRSRRPPERDRRFPASSDGAAANRGSNGIGIEIRDTRRESSLRGIKSESNANRNARASERAKVTRAMEDAFRSPSRLRKEE